MTFSSPENGTRLIKRVIGLPGDTIEMRGKRLYVNGVAADYAELGLADEPLAPSGVKALHLEEEYGRQPPRNPVARAPRQARRFRTAGDPGRSLPDARRQPRQQRGFALVRPRAARELIGRAERILVSADYKDTWALRFERFGKSLY